MCPPDKGPVVLIASSDESTRSWIEATVGGAGLHASSFCTAARLRSSLEPDRAACAVLDVRLTDACGLELQADLARAGVSVVFVTRECSIATCVKAVKAGAVDFLKMPCDAAQLVRALHHAMRLALSSWTKRVQFGELRSRYDQLTTREREVFALASSGLLNKQTAERLDISEITVQMHRGRVMRKMQARSFASLVRMADALQP